MAGPAAGSRLADHLRSPVSQVNHLMGGAAEKKTGQVAVGLVFSQRDNVASFGMFTASSAATWPS